MRMTRWHFRFGLVLTVLASSPVAAAALCPWDPESRPEPQATIDIDKVWAGARVDFAAISRSRHYIIGYYNQERWLTIAHVDVASHAVERQQLPTRFAGWDSHNSVAMALDRNGILHVAANMHAARLNYFRSTGPDEPLAEATIAGTDTDLVTYPQFLNSADGDLLFIYRSGKSGDGEWKVNRWDGRIWAGTGDRPILSNRGFGHHVSGYPSRFAIAADGYVHLAIVWRLTADAATNVRISYAKTRDFISWFDSRGQRLAAPLSPETTETVLHSGPNAGLLNNVKIALDARGRPVITFTRQDAQGHNTVELMIGDRGQWQQVLIATSEHGIPVKDTGSLPDTVALSEVDFSRANRPTLYYRFPGTPGVHQSLDPATLASACQEKPSPDIAAKYIQRPIPTMRPQILPIDKTAVLVWAAQPANNDRQPACTDAAPLACTPPPSPLKLLLDGKQVANTR